MVVSTVKTGVLPVLWTWKAVMLLVGDLTVTEPEVVSTLSTLVADEFWTLKPTALLVTVLTARVPIARSPDIPTPI